MMMIGALKFKVVISGETFLVNIFTESRGVKKYVGMVTTLDKGIPILVSERQQEKVW